MSNRVCGTNRNDCPFVRFFTTASIPPLLRIPPVSTCALPFIVPDVPSLPTCLESPRGRSCRRRSSRDTPVTTSPSGGRKNRGSQTTLGRLELLCRLHEKVKRTPVRQHPQAGPACAIRCEQVETTLRCPRSSRGRPSGPP